MFPSKCSLIWVVVAAVSSFVVLQLRAIPNIGVVSIVNVLTVLVPNIIMIASFFVYIRQGTRKAGKRVAWPPRTLDAFVSIPDIVFAFSGHVVFLELMEEMTNPEE
jgi:choline-glycine betaine transporter